MPLGVSIFVFILFAGEKGCRTERIAEGERASGCDGADAGVGAISGAGAGANDGDGNDTDGGDGNGDGAFDCSIDVAFLRLWLMSVVVVWDEGISSATEVSSKLPFEYKTSSLKKRNIKKRERAMRGLHLQ